MRGVLAASLLVVLAGCAGPFAAGTTTGDGAARVVDVIDGDTVEVEFPDGTRETVRLLGVDTPETDGEVSPDEFDGVPDTEAARQCLARTADEATAFLEQRLGGRRVRVVTDPEADRRGDYGRLLAYVRVPGANRSVNRALLDRGLARVFVTDFSRVDAFRAAARNAQADSRGLWACE